MTTTIPDAKIKAVGDGLKVEPAVKIHSAEQVTYSPAEERQLVELLQTVINKLTAAVLKLRLRTTGMSVLFETSLGDIVIDLEVDSCPKTCENFLKLCKVYYYNLNAFFNGKFQTLNVSYFRLN